MAMHHHHDSPVVVDEPPSDGPATALIAIVAAAVIALMVWLFVFSGLVFDRAPANEAPDRTTRIEQENNFPAPGGDTQSGGDTQTETQPQTGMTP